MPAGSPLNEAVSPLLRFECDPGNRSSLPARAPSAPAREDRHRHPTGVHACLACRPASPPHPVSARPLQGLALLVPVSSAASVRGGRPLPSRLACGPERSAVQSAQITLRFRQDVSRRQRLPVSSRFRAGCPDDRRDSKSLLINGGLRAELGLHVRSGRHFDHASRSFIVEFSTENAQLCFPKTPFKYHIYKIWQEIKSCAPKIENRYFVVHSLSSYSESSTTFMFHFLKK
ncbi:hypothetical protein NDU88_002038 [Pleurodeles waltl]|uniref:Uncharacterized protein n=1 Tax=Pleurodeles waltl TaxID=8319 RepID=A0AAV7MRM0_PLEWA|nr:hypothetical protein NDU88_002038 [Pleurodeles waltl]